MSTCQWLFIGVIFSYGLWQVNENFYFLLRYSQDVEIGRQGFISDDVIQHFTHVECMMIRDLCNLCIVEAFCFFVQCVLWSSSSSLVQMGEIITRMILQWIYIHIYIHMHTCVIRTGKGCKSYYSFFTGKKDVNNSIHVSIHRVCTLLKLLFDFSFPDLWSSDQTRFQFCREFFGSFLF